MPRCGGHLSQDTKTMPRRGWAGLLLRPHLQRDIGTAYQSRHIVLYNQPRRGASKSLEQVSSPVQIEFDFVHRAGIESERQTQFRYCRLADKIQPIWIRHYHYWWKCQIRKLDNPKCSWENAKYCKVWCRRSDCTEISAVSAKTARGTNLSLNHIKWGNERRRTGL